MNHYTDYMHWKRFTRLSRRPVFFLVCISGIAVLFAVHKHLTGLLTPQQTNIHIVRSNHTVVTAYFELPSKHSHEHYEYWMSNMLSLQDPMVIFASSQHAAQIRQFRSHAVNRTVIVQMNISELPPARKYSQTFWQDQLDMDPEKKIHKSYQLFWVWLSKSWFVTQAIQQNPFHSEMFVWSDIGCFRKPKLFGETMVRHAEIISRNSILQMAHVEDPKPPPTVWWNDKFGQPLHYYHSGSQAAGYRDTWLHFHECFMKKIDGFISRNMFVGEDQAVLQSTCLQHPDLCEYITKDQVDDNKYFGLRYALHYGGNYTKWKPPPKGESI